MNKTPNQIKREKKDYLRGSLKNMNFWGLLVYYLWIVRLRVDVDKYTENPCYPYDYTLKVNVVNPWNPLAYFFALGLLIGYVISLNFNIRSADLKDWEHAFKFE